MARGSFDKAGKVLYRALLKAARTFDDHPATKALICRGLGDPLPEPLDTAIAAFLGGPERCFFWPSPLLPQSVVDAVRIYFRYPTVSEPTIDGGFQGLRYLNALLNIAKNSGMLEKQSLPSERASSASSSASTAFPAVTEISQPQRGAILIAHPCLPNWFSRSVVLLCDHTSTGTLGLCLNKPWGGDVLDLVAQGRKAGAGDLGLDLRTGTNAVLSNSTPSSSTASLASHIGASGNDIGIGGATSTRVEDGNGGIPQKMRNMLFGGRKKSRDRTNSTKTSTTSHSILPESFPLRNAIVLNELSNDNYSSDGDNEVGESSSSNSSSEIENLEDDFSSDFSDTDSELQVEDLEKYFEEKHSGDDEEDSSALEDEQEEEEEEQRRERLYEALHLISNSSPLPHVFDDDNSEGVELVFETDDEETMKIVAAAAHALTQEWDKTGDISSLSQETLTAIDGLVDGPQKEALMAMLDALGATHRRIIAAQHQEKKEEGEENDQDKNIILPFPLPPPNQENFTVGGESPTSSHVSSVFRIHGGRANFSAGTGIHASTNSNLDTGQGQNTSSGGDGGGGGIDQITDTGVGGGGASASKVTPKELMAMSPKSEIFFGGPLPGVYVLHTRGNTLGGNAVLGRTSINNSSKESTTIHSTNSDNNNTNNNDITAVMFGTDATVPRAAHALALEHENEEDNFVAKENKEQGEEGRSHPPSAVSAEQLKFYLGASQWAPTQLQQEILKGTWTMIKIDFSSSSSSSSAVDVFEALGGGSRVGVDKIINKINPSEVQAEAWQRALGMISPAHAALAAVPESAWQELQMLEI